MAFVDDFGFCGPTYLAISPTIDAQRSYNLIPEPSSPTSKTKMALIGRPGLSPSPFSTLGTSPVRALWAGNNRLFAVAGNNFYELAGNGGVLTNYGAMAGASNGTYCTIKANGTQLLVYDSSAAQVYYADPVTPAMTSVFGGVALEYLDGFYISLASVATAISTQGVSNANPNQMNVSAIGDGTNWPALNYVIRTGSADLTNQLAVLNGQLWIFGQKTIEVWYNAGNPLFPFARIQGASINLGLMSPASVVKFYNTIMWLGSDDTGYAQVYMTKGLSPVRVSNAAIERIIGGVNAGVPGGNAAVLPQAWAYGYQEEGHTFYVLNIVSQTNVPLQTLVYDLSTGLWHERLYNIAGPYPICFASCPGFNSSGPNFVGDQRSGKIYFQGVGYPSDGGIPIYYERTAPHISKNNLKMKHRRFELDGDFGTATPTLTWSNDGGRTFKPGARAMQQASDVGEPTDEPTYQRFFCDQLGAARTRAYRVAITDSANLIRIVNADLDVVDGTEDKAAA